MAAAAEAAAAALPSEGQGGMHFAIPEGTTTIKGPDFYGGDEDSWGKWGVDKTKATHVTIPSSVTSIGDNAFYGCSSLASLAIPPSVTSIGDDAFYGCSSLASLAIPSSVTSIGDYAFTLCSALASLEITSSVNSIGDYAFYGCSSLASLTIPSSVTSIGANAFKNCANLATLVVFRPYAGSPAVSLTALAVHAGAFQNCPNIKVVSAPDVVVAALGKPYAGCSTLGALPPSVTFSASKLQLETYFWSMKLHRNTNRLSARQCAWVKHLLTVGSRVRLHWRPVNKGPRSVPCIPIPEHPPLPCVMNDIWLLVLEFVLLSELGALA